MQHLATCRCTSLCAGSSSDLQEEGFGCKAALYERVKSRHLVPMLQQAHACDAPLKSWCEGQSCCPGCCPACLPSGGSPSVNLAGPRPKEPLSLRLFRRPAAHEGVDSNMPPIGIPGSIDWPQGKADAYYFATIQMRQPSGVTPASPHSLPPKVPTPLQP